MKIRLFQFACLLFFTGIVCAEFPPPVFFTDYKVDTLGEFSLSSEQIGEDELLLKVVFTPQGLFGNLIGTASTIEVKTAWHDGRLVPRESKHFDGGGETIYTFDAQGLSVGVKYDGEDYDLPLVSPDIFELVSMHIQLAVDAADNPSLLFYDAVAKGKLRRYVFFNKGTETITTDIGNLKTVRFDGFRKGKLRYRYWLSSTHRYLIVKAELIRDSQVKHTVDVLSIKFS